jgi:DNA topoisomerase-3
MLASAMPSRDEIGAKLNGQSSMINGQLPPDDSIIGKPCPVCGKGHIIKGKAAYGCSEWKSGCTFRHPFKQ